MKLGLGVSSLSLAAMLATLGAILSGGCSAPSSLPDGAVGTASEPVTVCAGSSTVSGVDVSTYQGSVDWAAVHSSGRDFAFARVSDGTMYPDDTFATNWAGIKAAGMVRGVYQFFRASQDPTAQAELLVTAVGTFEAGDLSPVADVEVMDGESGAALVANLATWVSVIEKKTGRTPMIYASPGFWDALPSTTQFAKEGAWVANWGVSCPDTSTPWTSWAFWQTADDGSVTGISGAVDVDVFNGTLAQLKSLGGATADAGTKASDAGGGVGHAGDASAAASDGGQGAGHAEDASAEASGPAGEDAGIGAVDPEDGGEASAEEPASASAATGSCATGSPGTGSGGSSASLLLGALAVTTALRRRAAARREQRACL